MKNTSGTLRIVSASGENRISFAELYTDKARLENIRLALQQKTLSLYCGCSSEKLPLTITANGIIRVAKNGEQSKHARDCPKSETYESFVKEHVKGYSIEQEQPVLQILMPAVIKSSSSGGSGGSTGKEPNHRAGISELLTYLFRFAWERQSFSIRKKIKNREPWVYKDYQQFLRLCYGCSNDLFIHCTEGTMALSQLLYRAPVFFAEETDYRARFFFFGEVYKTATFKPERKYQYVTLHGMSNEKKAPATVRIPTEMYEKVFFTPEGKLWEGAKDTMPLLAGFCHKSSFRSRDGTSSSWISVLKCDLFSMNEYGMLVKNDTENKLYHTLIEKGLLFLLPYVPIMDYDGIPSALVPFPKEQPDLILDVVSSRKQLQAKQHIVTEKYKIQVFAEEERS